MPYSELINRQRCYFATGATSPLQFRLEALRKLRQALEDQEVKLLASLYADLRKPAHEALASDITFVVSEIEYAIKNLRQWIKPQRRGAPRMAWPARAAIVPSPLGVALILGTWNYPVQLLLMPLVGAIAAGNCAILKPSEMAPQTATVLADLIRGTFDDQHIALVTGDREVAESLLEERFDSIFFTGSAQAGRSVMAAAAKHLTPVTLELGGKCPCIVCADAPLRSTARRIIWAKMLNAGQSCVAPDFVLADKVIAESLIAEMKLAISEFYGPDPLTSPDFGRIVNERRFDQATKYLGDGKVILGGQHDRTQLYIAPTLMTELSPASSAMNEEIFGPILPVVTFKTIEEALSTVNARPSPLAIYFFARDRTLQDRFVSQTRSGGVCVNNAVLHMVGKRLPFGGLGESGMGRYHGKASFDNFSHQRTVVRCSPTLEVPLRYPPQRLSISRFKQALGFLLRH